MVSDSTDGSGMSGKELYLRLLQRVKPYWKPFGGALSAMVILAMTEPMIPVLMKPMLDGSFVEKDPDYVFWSPILLILLFTFPPGSAMQRQHRFSVQVLLATGRSGCQVLQMGKSWV